MGEKLLIRELKYPMIEQPSRAQLLNLKPAWFEASLDARIRPSRMQEYPDQVASYQRCNASFAELLAFGAATSKNPSPDCEAMVVMAFPDKKATHPSGLTNDVFADAGESPCYQDFLAAVRRTADICSQEWQQCGEGCVELVPEDDYGGSKCGGGVLDRVTGTRHIALINDNVVLMRVLLNKILHLADVIYYLTTGVQTSKRGVRCGTAWPHLLDLIPQLRGCQLHDYFDPGSQTQCYKNTRHAPLNPPFYIDPMGNCSVSCQAGLSTLLSLYGCCPATDRVAIDEYWSRVSHPIFKHFIIDWGATGTGVAPIGSGPPEKHEVIYIPPLDIESSSCEAQKRSYMDCALSRCKHTSGDPNPLWEGWQDYPESCCNVTCDAVRSTKPYRSSCNCKCKGGFVGSYCNETTSHVLAEFQLAGISGEAFEMQGKQARFGDVIAKLVELKSCQNAEGNFVSGCKDVEIDFFVDGRDVAKTEWPASAESADDLVRRRDAFGGNEEVLSGGLDGEGGGGEPGVSKDEVASEGEAFPGMERRAEEGEVIVRYRVLSPDVREAMRIAQMLTKPAEIMRLFQEDGMASKVRNTFKPLTYTGDGEFLCDDILYKCPGGEVGAAVGGNDGSGNNTLLMPGEIAGIVAGGSVFIFLFVTYWCMSNWETISEFGEKTRIKMKDYEEAGVQGAQKIHKQVGSSVATHLYQT